MKKVIVFFVLVTFLSEGILRYGFGFCDDILMREDSAYEYIAKANQSRKRFGNRIIYNSYSMRNNEIDSVAKKIICIGDSVINGGALTDHEELASTILTDSLSNSCKQKIQVLNISAGSWGPDNAFAYLKKHGFFDAEHFFLFVSSHDAYDNMDFNKIVGVNKSFPDSQYKIAVWEALDRYIIPKTIKLIMPKKRVKELGINKKSIVNSKFNTGFNDIYKFCDSLNIPLTIYLHADKIETSNNQYNLQGQEIINFCVKNNVKILKELDYKMNNNFRDKIHLNASGQQQLAEIIFNQINCNL